MQTANLSTNTTGVLRKLNPDNLDEIVDVPLVNGTVIEMPGHQAIKIFNTIVGNGLRRKARRAKAVK